MSLRRLLLLSSRHLHLHRPLPPPLIPPPSFLSSLRSLSSATASTNPSPSDIARSISDALAKISAAASPSLDLADHFSLHFADVSFNTRLLSEVLDISPAAGRSALDLYRYLIRHRGFTPNDLSLSYMIHYFGRRLDFKAIRQLLSDFPRSAGPQSIAAAVDRAGCPTQAIAFFEILERDLGIKRSLSHLKLLVTALADHKFAGHAERIVKKFADEEICTELIRGWCHDLKLDKARRLAG